MPHYVCIHWQCADCQHSVYRGLVVGHTSHTGLLAASVCRHPDSRDICGLPAYSGIFLFLLIPLRSPGVYLSIPSICVSVIGRCHGCEEGRKKNHDDGGAIVDTFYLGVMDL